MSFSTAILPEPGGGLAGTLSAPTDGYPEPQSLLNGTSSEGGDHADPAARRLEEMARVAPPPELSPATITINEQRQDDEVLALQSIYGDDVFAVSKIGGLRHLEVYIHHEFPDGIEVSAMLMPSNDSGGSVYSFKLQYLPPWILSCMLPLSYPSDQLPFFTLDAPWLAASEASSLCDKLNTIWAEQPRQEVIFQWVDWLYNSSPSYLGFDDRIELHRCIGTVDVDDRLVSIDMPVESVVPLMIRYNKERCDEVFLQSLQECSICFTEDLGSKFLKLPCQHFYCINCLETYCKMHVKEGTVLKLLCPEDKCKGPFPPNLLKGLLTEEDFGRWESFVLQRALESMSDVVYCPRCRTGCLKDEDGHAQCSKCFFSFCCECNEPRHVGQKCVTLEEKLARLQARQGSSSVSDSHLRKEQDLINEMLSIREVFQDAKPCPSCKMAISRTEGCNKMVCRNCGQFFCFRCNRAISGYDHFDGHCKLFPDEDDKFQHETELDTYQLVQQIRSQLEPGRGYSCPNCSQLNRKIGDNNHIFCWACQIHYCAVCQRKVTKRAQHYGPKGCKQFTSDGAHQDENSVIVVSSSS